MAAKEEAETAEGPPEGPPEHFNEDLFSCFDDMEMCERTLVSLPQLCAPQRHRRHGVVAATAVDAATRSSVQLTRNYRAHGMQCIQSAQQHG